MNKASIFAENGSVNNGCLLYGITPPKRTVTDERLHEIAAIQADRCNRIAPDALVLYDIQDESARIEDDRPFPFVRTVRPEEYVHGWLTAVASPKVIYHSIAGESAEVFRRWLLDHHPEYLVLVGAPSRKIRFGITLSDACAIVRETAPGIRLGGIVIPERHNIKRDEHLRLWSKMLAGCSFFISQCVYSIESSKNMLSEYQWHCRRNGMETAPVVFTLTPCGTPQTLEFMRWLGIAVPDWIRNELLHAENMLEMSVRICIRIAEELTVFCRDRSIPFGFNIESVSARKAEIEASEELFSAVRDVLLSGRKTAGATVRQSAGTGL